MIAAGGTVVVAVALAGCTKNSGQPTAVDQNRRTTGVIATDPKDSLGPAPQVSGAVSGGTITILRPTKLVHLDPQRVYSFAGLENVGLYARFLTTWRQDGTGRLTLVGDLATTPGVNVDAGCRTWRFTIKDGLRFEDGSPITSREIAYGIARSFDPAIAGGPTYLQEWLADSAQFDTVWDFASHRDGLPPGLTTPDAKTLTFSFKRAHCDLPFAASLPTTAPLRPDRDTGVNYDQQPFASGPYKIRKGDAATELQLERNQYWDPATDPVRHQYPDRFVWSYGGDAEASANRVLADAEADRTALAFGGVPASLTARVAGDPSLQPRRLLQAAANANRLTINLQRVTDLRVRRALNYAINREGLIKALGGAAVATPLTSLMPPNTIGYERYDAYPAGPTGDIDQARRLLAGATPELVLGVADDPGDVEVGTQLKNDLERAGFRITVKTIPVDAKLDETKRMDNPWDLYVDSWAADWPSGAAIIPPLFDGRGIRPEGGSNTSFMNDPAINAEIDRILALEPGAQGASWAALDKRIMTDVAPAVPLYTDVACYVFGSRLGGLYIDGVFGYPAFLNAYAKAA